MSQNDQILEHLKRGRSLTPLAALDRFGVFRLAARVNDLRSKGWKIKATMVPTIGTKKKVASYSL